MSQEETQETGQEVATDSQETPIEAPEFNKDVAESRKYRLRAQKAESERDNLKKQIENNRVRNLEEKEEWKTLAEERGIHNSKLEEENQVFKSRESKKINKLLSDFSDEDRETFGGLSLDQLETVHKKLHTTPSPVSVDNSTPSSTGGYASFEEWAAVDPDGYEKANGTQTSGKRKIGYGG